MNLIHRRLLAALFCAALFCAVLFLLSVPILRLSWEPRYKGVVASEWRERVRKRIDETSSLSRWKPGPEFLDAAGRTDSKSFSVLRTLLHDPELLIRGEAMAWLSDMDPKIASKALPDVIELLQMATERGEIRDEIMLIGSFGVRAKSAIPLIRKVELSGENDFIRQLAKETIQRIDRAK